MISQKLETTQSIKGVLMKNNPIPHNSNAPSEIKEHQMPQLNTLDRKVNIILELEHNLEALGANNRHILEVSNLVPMQTNTVTMKKKMKDALLKVTTKRATVLLGTYLLKLT